MAQHTVEFVCTTCGLAEDVPVNPVRFEAVICDGCGGRMVVAMDEADEADRSFTVSTARPAPTAVR